MKSIFKKIVLVFSIAVLGIYSGLSKPNNQSINLKKAVATENDLSILSVALNETKSCDITNESAFKNSPFFSSNANNFSANITTYLYPNPTIEQIESESVSSFCKDYAQKYSLSNATSLDTSIASVDAEGMFSLDSRTKSFKNRKELYELYCASEGRKVVDVDWNSMDIDSVLSSQCKKDLSAITTINDAKTFINRYGTHVFRQYIFGGRLILSKYTTKDEAYNLSESEKAVETSLKTIVSKGTSSGQAGLSFDVSDYEKSFSESSQLYSQTKMCVIGGNSFNALNLSGLFTYNAALMSETGSGYVYKAWIESFNNETTPQVPITAKDPISVWSLLGSGYSNQKVLLEQAFNSLCFKNYSENCTDKGVSCDYIESIQYDTNGSSVNIVPSIDNKAYIPQNTVARVSLSDSIAKSLSNNECSLSVSDNSVAFISNNDITILDGTNGHRFDLIITINGDEVYRLNFNIEKEQASGGFGSASQPFLLKTASDFKWLIDSHGEEYYFYSIIADIDFDGGILNPSSFDFNGTIDGNGHTISNFTILSKDFNNSWPYLGIIGKNNGSISNLIIKNAVILSNGLIDATNTNCNIYAGVLTGLNCGLINNVQIKKCAIRFASKNGEKSVANIGGICGGSESLIKYSAVSDSNICGVSYDGKGQINIGGLTGLLKGSTIEKSYVCRTKLSSIYSGNKPIMLLGGLTGMASEISQISTNTSSASLTPKISSIKLCLAYDLIIDSTFQTIGFISGDDDKSTQYNCYYKSDREISVNNDKRNGCQNLSVLTLSTINNSNFKDEWMDTENGPVLKIHEGE